MIPDSAITLWTIGHSTRTLDELVELLRSHGVERVLDVRTVPRSRRHPHFDREALPAPLASAGIAYRHLPELGGLRQPRADSLNTGWREPGFRGYADHMQSGAFERALDECATLGRERPSALMCAEAVPWRCHRSLIADALVARRHRVLHVLSRESAREHRLTPFARIDGGARITYPGLL